MEVTLGTFILGHPVVYTIKPVNIIILKVSRTTTRWTTVTLSGSTVTLSTERPNSEYSPYTTSEINTSLHYITVHYTSLHYSTLHITTLHYSTLDITTIQLQYTKHHYTTLQYT